MPWIGVYPVQPASHTHAPFTNPMTIPVVSGAILHGLYFRVI